MNPNDPSHTWSVYRLRTQGLVGWTTVTREKLGEHRGSLGEVMPQVDASHEGVVLFVPHATPTEAVVRQNGALGSVAAGIDLSEECDCEAEVVDGRIGQFRFSARPTAPQALVPTTVIIAKRFEIFKTTVAHAKAVEILSLAIRWLRPTGPFPVTIESLDSTTVNGRMTAAGLGQMLHALGGRSVPLTVKLPQDTPRFTLVDESKMSKGIIAIGEGESFSFRGRRMTLRDASEQGWFAFDLGGETFVFLPGMNVTIRLQAHLLKGFQLYPR